jgi:hypothetical protein
VEPSRLHLFSLHPALGNTVPVAWQRGAVPPPGSQPETLILPSHVKAAEWKRSTVGAVVVYRCTGLAGSVRSKTAIP